MGIRPEIGGLDGEDGREKIEHRVPYRKNKYSRRKMCEVGLGKLESAPDG